MVHFTNILVPTDFSDNSLQALELAQYIALPNKAALHVLHVIEPTAFNGTLKNRFHEEKFEHYKLLGAEEELRRFTKKIQPQELRIFEAIDRGKAYEQILSYSIKNHIDLIVIASHGWTGLSHLITGNVANKVMRFSEVPVICVKTSSLGLQKDNSVHKSTFAENWFG